MTAAEADAPRGRATRTALAPNDLLRAPGTASPDAPLGAAHRARGSLWGRADPGRRAVRSARAVLLALRLMIVAVLFGQRLALPIGATRVPVVLVAVYAVLVVLVAGRALRHDRVRFELFEVGMAACCATTLIAAFRAEPFSVASLVYLLLSYLPWIFCVRATFAWMYPIIVRFFLDAMALVALLAVAQMAAQLVGLPYPDPVSSLPAGLLVENFNTTYPIVYGSAILKSNGMVMLEPSFLSQYLALAGVAAVMTRAPLWRLALYGAALAASVSGTGFVLALAGLAVLLVRAPGRLRPTLVWPALALVAVMLATPLGVVLAERRSELGEGGSSATLRFLTPYREVAEGLAADPDRYLTGAGPGASDRVLESGRGRAGLAVVYPSLPKLVFEYGLVSGLLFGAFMALCLFWRTRLAVIPTCCFLMLFLLSGSLLQPHTVFLVWMLTSLFGRSDAEAAAFGAARRVSLAVTRSSRPRRTRAVTEPGTSTSDAPAAKPPRSRSDVGGRAGWGLADQVVSSLTNAGLSIVIARSVDAAGFGAFGVTFAVFSFTLGSSRALASDPLVIRYSAATTEGFRQAVAGATGLALVLGVAGGAMVLAAGAALGGTVGAALRALAVVLPGLLLQDAWRHAFLAASRPRAALVNDLVWGAVQFVAIGLLVATRAQTVPLLVLGWGGAALVAAGLGLAQMRVFPRPGRAVAWLREHADLGPLLVLEYAITMGAFNAALLVIGLIGGLAEVGAIRAAQVLLGPLQVLFLGATAITVPEFSRRTDRSSRTLARYAALVSGALGCAAAAWLVVLLLLPERFGSAVLGDTWPGARSALPFVGLMMISIGVATGPALLLRALAAGRRVLRVSALQAPLTLVLGVGGAIVGSAPGAAGGIAAAHWVGVLLWGINLRAQLRVRTADAASP